MRRLWDWLFGRRDAEIVDFEELRHLVALRRMHDRGGAA